MNPGTKWLAEQSVLRAIIGGFALVVVLLGLAGVVAVRGTHAIENDTAQVVREQLVIARLLNDVQAEQNTLAAVLHQVAHMPDSANREQLMASLQNADHALRRIASSAVNTPEAGQWRDLEMTVRQFSDGVIEVIRRGGKASPQELAALFDRHDEVVRVEQALLDLSERRVADSERDIEEASQNLARQSQLLLGACFALALLCAVLTVTFARRSIRRMEWQSSELNRVSWHMLQGQEAAARRFSHELHDELGQALAALKAMLNAATPKSWPSRREESLHLVDDAIANVRELSQLLRPVILDDFGLDAGLRWLTDRFGERTGIDTEYESSFGHRLPEETETHLFRITQEALTNVARHSGATRVRVELRSVGDTVHLSIEDNGRGLATEAPSQPSLGMIGMRARAGQTNGALDLTRPSGGGLRIEVTVPWVRQLEEHAEQKIRILLADDHAVVRRGFRMILDAQDDLEVVGEVANGREAVARATELHPDVIVMDVTMPELNGIEATRRIADASPRTRVLALSMHKDAVYVREILRAGARGYLLKDSPEGDFLGAVRAVARGEGYLSPAVSDAVLTDYRKHVTNPLDLLTSREREVLQWIAEGKTNKEIATALNLSVYTVEAHRGKIMEKLNLHSSGELVRFAVRNGLID